MYTSSFYQSQGNHQQRFLNLFEQGISILVLVFFLGVFDTIFSDSPSTVTKLRYSFALIALVFSLLRWRSTLRAIRKGGLIWLLLGFTAVSFMWSNYPDAAIESIRGEIVPMTAFSLYFATRFGPNQQLRLLSIALGIAALICLFYIVAIPSVGIHANDRFSGAWKGIYASKNAFSAYMTMTLVTFFVLGTNNKNWLETLLARIASALSIVMIVLSTSKTGLVVFMPLAFVILAYQRFRWRGRRTVFLVDAACLVILILGVYIFSNWELLVSTVGGDPTLTGRTLIWESAFSKLGSNLWLGFGRESFWLPDNPIARGVPGLSEVYMPAHAHNGFIDLVVDLGIIGLTIFLIGYVATLVLSLKRSYCATTPEDLWPIALMMIIVASNLTESLLMKRANLFWVLYLINFLSLRIWPKSSSPKQVSYD